MTIYKVIPQEKKQEKKTTDKEAVSVPLTENEGGEPAAPAAVRVDIRHQRSKMWLNFFLIIIALLVLATGITGGYYIYRNHHSPKISRGKCRVMIPIEAPNALPLEDVVSKEKGIKYGNDALTANKQRHPKTYRRHHHRPTHQTEIEIEEEIEVIDGTVEKMRMPRFRDILDSLILHDFERNYSAIVDFEDEMCYVMKLNRQEVAPPKNILDLFNKIKTGYYLPRADILIRKYYVVTPALSDIQFLGRYIVRECSAFKTYKLERMTGDELGSRMKKVKRSAQKFKKFAWYGGQYVMEEEIRFK